MKHSNFNSVMNFCNHFRPRNLFGLSFYSTSTKTKFPRKSWKGSLRALYRNISKIEDPKAMVSIVPVLDKWILDGQEVDKSSLLGFIKEFRRNGRYNHALQISMWMTDKRYYPLTYGDVTIRLDLISRVHGIEQAENYFSNLPRQFKLLEVYSTLLNCYVRAEQVEKAEAVMQQMKDIGLASDILAYNLLLNLYYKTGSYGKMDNLLHEMEEKGTVSNNYTYAICAYAAKSDVEGIHKILTKMESDPEVLDWSTYSIAASGCIKAGLVDKALLMLKKSEELISTAKTKSVAFEHILTQYTAMRKKDEVLRLWELYNKQQKKRSQAYMSMIISLLKFDDVESAEKIFEEWESQNLNYDIRLPNFLIAAYCRKGLFEKAESIFNRVIEKGGKPDAKTWHFLATLYIKQNQMQKATEAIKQELSVVGFFWKPSMDCLAACLEYLKGIGYLEGAQEIIRLVRDKGFVSVDVQERLLNYIKDGNSNSQVIEILGDAMDGDEETSKVLAEEEDGSKSINMLETNA